MKKTQEILLVSNGDDLDAICVESPRDFRTETDGSLFPGMVKITGRAVRRRPWSTDGLYRRYVSSDLEECTVTAIPYAFWDNREDTREMIVWIRK